jgi:DNA polymerase-3 subunit alpha
MSRARLVDVVPAREPQWLAGTIAALRTQMTRRGKMVFVTLDDGSAKIDISVFAELFERHRNLFREDEFLLVQGRVSHDEYSEGLRVMADRVLDLTGARMQFARRLRLRMNGQSHDEKLRELLEPFRAHPSRSTTEHPPVDAQTAQTAQTAQDLKIEALQGCPVEIDYRAAQASCRIALGEDWRVRPDEALIGALRAWLTPEGAQLEYE